MARIRVVVEVNSDEVEGFFYFNNEEKFKEDFQRVLNDDIGHYNPVVISAEKINVEHKAVPEFIVATKEEAERVLNALTELLSTREKATVSDLKVLVGLPITYSDQSWRWSNLDDAKIREVSGGFLLDLPFASRTTYSKE